MGNDGGSIPKRRELVKEAAKNPTTQQIKETQQEQQEYLWAHDPLSRKPLARPVVSDSNGKLYNKDSVLEHLLALASGDSIPTETETLLQGAVKSIKDVVELKFTVDDGAANKTNGSSTGRTEVWLCPVTNEPLGPSSKAAYLVPCGHVFSGAAIKEVGEDKCVVCETAYAPNDVIPILPTAKEDIARLLLRTKNLKEQGLAHSLKKAGKKEKKSKKRDREEESQVVAPVKVNEKDSSNGAMKKAEAGGGINNSSTKALAEKVLAEEERRKKLKAGNENLKSLFSSRDQTKPLGKSSDFMTRGFDIPASARR